MIVITLFIFRFKTSRAGYQDNFQSRTVIQTPFARAHVALTIDYNLY